MGRMGGSFILFFCTDKNDVNFSFILVDKK